MKLFNKTIDRQLFKQYSLGSDLSKQEVVAKIFNPTGAGNWFILNSDPEDPDYLWAIVDLGYGAEVGSVSRTELETYRNRFGMGFERDLSFDPVNALELYKGLREGKYYAKGGGVGSSEENTFDKIFLHYGFTKKRGAYGIRPYEHKKLGTYAQIDDKTRSIEIETPDNEYKGGYSVKGVIDFLKSKGFEETGSYADGGQIEVVYERRADFKKKPIKLLLLNKGKEQKGFTFSGKDQVAVLENYNRNKQEDLEKLWNLKGYESKYADGGSLGNYDVVIDGDWDEPKKFKTFSLAKKWIYQNTKNYESLELVDPYGDTIFVEGNSTKEDLDWLFSNDEVSAFAKGGNIADFSDNQQMIMNQNVELEHHHEELEDILENEMPVPAWVVAKMATATQSISDVTHYLDGQKELMQDEDEEENEEEEEDQDEIENKEVVEPINVSAGTKSELTKKFTDDAWGNLRGFLKGMEGIDLRDDYTFDYKNEQFEVEPIINSDENGVSNAVFTIFDGDGEEVGEVAYSRDGGKQKFTANSDYFQWNNAKFEDGGYFDGTIPKVSSYMSTYAKGGSMNKHFWSWKYAPNDNSFKSVIIYKTDIDDENSYDSVEQIKEQLTKEGVNKFIEEDLKHFWSWKYAPNDNSFKSVIIYKTDIDDENSYDSVKQIKEQLVKEGVTKFIEEDEENYAKGGEVAKAEILGLKRNFMGTTDIEMKISGMRKPQSFIVYPISKDDSGDIITIQSETRIGKIDLSSGRGLMSQSHSNGAYFVHFQMDKLTPFTISESDLEDIKAHIFRTAGDNVGTRGIVTDNSGASGVYAIGGAFNSKRMGDYIGKHFIWRNYIYYIVAFKKYENRVANPYNRDKKTTGSLKGSHFNPHFTIFEIELKDSLPVYDSKQRIVDFSVQHWDVEDMFDYINNKRKIKISNEKLPSKVQEFLDSKKELIYIHKKAKYQSGGFMNDVYADGGYNQNETFVLVKPFIDSNEPNGWRFSYASKQPNGYVYFPNRGIEKEPALFLKEEAQKVVDFKNREERGIPAIILPFEKKAEISDFKNLQPRDDSYEYNPFSENDNKSDSSTLSDYYAKGGGVGDNVLGLVKGDIFEVIDTEHTVTGEKFMFLDYEDKYGTIALKAIPYPPMLFKKLNDKDKIVYITDISSDGIKKLSDDKSGEMLVRRYKKYIQYNMEQGGSTEEYADGGGLYKLLEYALLEENGNEEYIDNLPKYPEYLDIAFNKNGGHKIYKVYETTLNNGKFVKYPTYRIGRDMKPYSKLKYVLKALDKKVYDENFDNDNYAKGGMVVTSVKDIPNFKERLEQRRITYRGLGMGKLADDFYKLAGTSGTRIKVDGKEYFITDEEFDTFSRDADGKMQIRFDAPARKGYANGGFMDNVYADGGKLNFKDRSERDSLKLANAYQKVLDSNFDETEYNKYIKIVKETQIPNEELQKIELYITTTPKGQRRMIDTYRYWGKNQFEDGGFMNDVYAKGGSVKKDWWHTVVNPNEDFNNFDDKMPIDWDVDDFKSWVVSNADIDGNVDKEVLDVVKMPKSKLTVEYLNKNGSGKNNNESYKMFGNWQSALYDIFTQMKKDYLFKKSLKYVLKADIKTVTVKTKNGKEVTYSGADVLNGNYVLAKGGDITSKATYFGKNNVVGVELKDGTTIKPANGYWVKKGAEPIGAEPTPTSSGKAEPKISTTEIRKDARGNWRAETNIDNFNGYDWRLSTVKTYSGNLVSSAQGGKTMPSGSKGINMFIYKMYQDPNHTLEVSKPKRLTDKVVTEQHEKAMSKFKKFMETGMFKGGGKISNFDKLSDKVAKEYEGKPVKSQYQEEYGKYYSKQEAQEVGDKVAGKVKAMQTDKKAFGGLFGGTKSIMTTRKYPDLDDKQVGLKSGKFVQVFSQSGKDLSVLDVGRIGSGERPYSIDISEVDPSYLMQGGQTSSKKVNGGTEMLKKANDLAKKIRKDGESWLDAKKRAFAQLKK